MKRCALLPIILVSFSTLMLLAGCSYVSVQSHEYLGMPNFAPTDPAGIEILHAPPKKPSERIGEITLEPKGNPPTNEIEQKLRQEAAQMGANAVVIVMDSTRMMGQYVTGPWWDGQIYPEWGRVIVAVAIRYVQNGKNGQLKPGKGEKPHKNLFRSATV
jgi:hypothetical protein